jgi:hypothetical protein
MLRSLLDLLDGKNPSQVVWTADLTYWIAGQPEEHRKEQDWESEAGHLNLCRQLGCMPYYWYDRFWAGEVTSSQVKITNTISGGLNRRVWETPLGNMVEETQILQDGASQAITRYPVQSKDDLKILIYILEHSQSQPTNLEDYHKRMQFWEKYDGLPSLALPRSPLPAFITEWAGVQNGIYLMMDEAELINRLLNLLEDLEENILEAICEIRPPLVHFPDNLTSEVYVPFFDTHMAERYQRRVERLHNRGIRCAVHLDGTVKGMLPLLAETGIDAIEALTPSPAGDVDVEEMRTIARNNQVILWGGIPGVMFAPPFTWVEMEQQVKKTLHAWQGTPFILGTADQVPPDGDIEMVRLISDMVMDI